MDKKTKEFIKKVEDSFESSKVSVIEFDKLLKEWGRLIHESCYQEDDIRKVIRNLHTVQLNVKWYGRECYSKKNSDLIAFLEYLNEYVLAEIQYVTLFVNEQERTTDNKTTVSESLSWTESKRSLIELICALHSAKCINGGNIKIQKMVVHFEQLFGVNLGNYHSEMNKMTLRKPADNSELRGYFLKKLIDGFNDKMINTR